ncbi:MAG: trigger factor [Vulcanimicrobiaceae bacterium]
MSATTLKRLDPTSVELEIAISADEFARAEARAYKQLARSARVPGFRPGKAPRSIFEAQYGHGIVHERALEQVVPEAYSQAVREHALDPVDRPQMEVLPVADEAEGVRLRATVAVRPEIALGNYKGIEIAELTLPVGDDDVERTLEGLRREAASLVPVDRGVEFGDVPTIDFDGTIDGIAFDGGKGENQPTEIVEDHFIPGFAQGIVGMAAGESKSVEAQFPEDYAKSELAGKKAVFAVTVHDVKTPELPPLDDEFAARFRPDSTVADLRADVRARLEVTAKNRARRTMSTALMERLLAAHDVPLPPVLVDRETDSILQEAKADAARHELEWAAYLESAGKTADEVQAEFRLEAERRVKSTLLLEAIAKAEKIDATPQDLDAELATLARQYGQPKERILELVQPNLGALVDGIVRSKTIEFLLDAAIATPVAPATAEPSA